MFPERFVSFKLFTNALGTIEDAQSKLVSVYIEMNHHLKHFLSLSDKIEHETKRFQDDPNQNWDSSLRRDWWAEYRFVVQIRKLMERLESESSESPVAVKAEQAAEQSEIKNELILLQEEYRALNNETRVKTTKILELKDRLKNQRYKAPPREELYDLAMSSLKKNGSINFSELGRKMRVTNKTAKSWCERYGITIKS